jgi:hypothetical protein
MKTPTAAPDDCAEETPSAVDRLTKQAAQYYLPRAQAASVVVVIEERGVERAMMYRLGLRFEALTLDDVDARPNADAVIVMTRETLESILSGPTTFDARSADFGGRIRIDGDAQAAHHLLQLLKRPAAAARERLERARASAPAALDNVPESHRADAAAILDAIRTSHPLCVRGGLKWPACSWTLDELAARHGEATLLGNADGRQISLRAFIDSLQAASIEPNSGASAAPYTDGCLLPSALAPLFPFPYFEQGAFSRAQIWAGAQRPDTTLVTRLHCDISTSFLAQVHGRKRVRLFSPGERERLYAMPTFNFYQPCLVDVARPDFARFPEFAQARYIEIVVGPGDLLIIPTGWYHCVWALDDVLSVSRFLDDDVAAYLMA